MKADTDLLEIVHARDARSPQTRPAQSGKQHAGEDADDGNDDQHFHEGKSATVVVGPVTFHVPEIRKARRMPCRVLHKRCSGRPWLARFPLNARETPPARVEISVWCN